jgi:SAM-dependent methyltransferase
MKLRKLHAKEVRDTYLAEYTYSKGDRIMVPANFDQVKYHSGRDNRILFEWLDKLIPKDQRHSALDIGCYIGTDTIQLAKLFKLVDGIEIDEEISQLAFDNIKQVSPKLAKRVRIMQGDALKMPYCKKKYGEYYKYGGIFHHLLEATQKQTRFLISIEPRRYFVLCVTKNKVYGKCEEFFNYKEHAVPWVRLGS